MQSAIDFDARPIIEHELGSVEKLLWAGRPCQGFVFRPVDAFLIPLSLMWGGFAVFWEGSVLVMGAPVFFTLWGIPFVLVGCYLVFGRFYVDAWQREKTSYGLTN